MLASPVFPSRLAAVCLILALALSASAQAQTYLPHFDPNGSGPTDSDQTNGTITAIPSLAAYRIDNNTITMDGVLDEPAWHRAQTGRGFRQADPERGDG